MRALSAQDVGLQVQNRVARCADVTKLRSKERILVDRHDVAPAAQ